MHKSIIRQLRKELANAQRKAADFDRRSQGAAPVVRDRLQAMAEEQRRVADGLAQRLGTRT